VRWLREHPEQQNLKLREHPEQQNLKPEVDEMIEEVLRAWEISLKSKA